MKKTLCKLLNDEKSFELDASRIYDVSRSAYKAVVNQAQNQYLTEKGREELLKIGVLTLAVTTALW